MSVPNHVWGPEVWRLLHHAEALGRATPAGQRQTWHFAMAVVRLLPCTCSASGSEMLRRLPPSPTTVHHLHNMVNAKLGRPNFPHSDDHTLPPEDAALYLVVVVVFLARARPGSDAVALVDLAASAAPGLQGFHKAAIAVARGGAPDSLATLGLDTRHQERLLANPGLRILWHHTTH